MTNSPSMRKKLIKIFLGDSKCFIWPKEMKIAAKLLEMYPHIEEEKWLEIQSKLWFRIDSLQFLISVPGRKFMTQFDQQKKINKPAAASVEIGEKVGEDRIIESKEKSIKEFLE